MGYVPDIGILLTHAHHYTLMTGTADDRTGSNKVNEEQGSWDNGKHTGRLHEEHRHLDRDQDWYRADVIWREITSNYKIRRSARKK